MIKSQDGENRVPDVEDPKVKTLKPDLVCIYPVDEQKKDYCFGIYDAKILLYRLSNTWR